MPTPAQQSLYNFYESVKVSNPRTAALMHTDILKVAIFSLGQNKSPAQESADNLRRMALEMALPEALRRVLESSLVGLGFE